jgi:hypothetical protein
LRLWDMISDGGRRRRKTAIASNPLKFLVSLFLSFSVQPRGGGSIRRISDAPDLIACRRTGQFVPAGIETDIDTFIALPEALSLTRCPHAAATIVR